MASLNKILNGNSSPSVLPIILPKVLQVRTGRCCVSDNSDAYLDHAKQEHEFSINKLAWAIQNGAGGKCVERYLGQLSKTGIADELGQPVQMTKSDLLVPILYFAAEQKSPEMIRILHHAGAKLCQRIQTRGSSTFGVPLLPYTILIAENKVVDTTDTVVTLLSLGADSNDVPSDMWQDYVKTPTKDRPQDLMASAAPQSWCTTEVREALCRTFNLLQRYSFWKAAQIHRPPAREMQVAMNHNITPLFQIPYFIFGQEVATEGVVQRITSWFLRESSKPLTLFFTGLSGHGKTELARRMGRLLSVELITIDCTMLRHDTDLLGPWFPYRGSEVGTPLNNHLVEWDGQRSVVFLDEFDKTTDEVRQAMLLLLESGSYTDRRNNKQVDCSKVIWILAANLCVDQITKYWTDKLQSQKEKKHRRQTGVPPDLQLILKQCIIDEFGAPLAGRLPAIIPFTPFNEGERAVTAYKFMRELWHYVRKPIDTERKHFLGNSFVNYTNDGQIATHIARRYLEQTGARSLADAVDEEIWDPLAAEFYADREGAGEIGDEMNQMPLTRYDVSVVGNGEGNGAHIEVAHVGTKESKQKEAE